MAKNAKNPWLSKTVLLGLLGTLAGIFQLLSQNAWILGHAGWILSIYSGLVFIQRFVTIFLDNKSEADAQVPDSDS